MSDPVKQLRYVLEAAEQREEFGHLLSHVRRIDENDKATLQRLVNGYCQTVRLLNELIEQRPDLRSAWRQVLQRTDGYGSADLKEMSLDWYVREMFKLLGH